MALSSYSMQVSLNQRVWQARTTDRRLAADLEQTSEAQHGTMSVLKSLVPREYTLPIKRFATFGREQHEKLTLPGFQRGQQLLATKLFDDYVAMQGEIKDRFYDAVRKFCTIYPEIVEQAPKRLGKSFRPADFPSESQIASYFSYEHRFFPVPDTGNWLVEDIDAHAMEQLRNEVENQKNQVFRDATRELIERAEEVLSRLINQIDAYPDQGTSNGLLRDATLKAVNEMALLLPAMNITADPAIDALGKEMQKKLAHMDGATLRSNKAERSAVGDIAKRIMEKMKGVQA
jgi:hypothetical protein